MTHADIFTSLPSQLTAVIVSTYLSMKDTAQLDMAFSCKETRKRFLALYKEEAFVLRIQYHSVVNFTPAFCSWALSRSVAVEGITLHKSWNTSHTEQLISYLKDCGSRVWFFNTNLDRAETMSVTQFKSIVKQCPEVKILAGVPIAFVTKHAMEVTRASCPNIFSITVFADEESEKPGSIESLSSLFEDGGLPKLSSLRVPAARDLSKALLVVAANCPLLEKLLISSSKYATLEDADAVLAALAANCHDLKELRAPAHYVTDEGMLALAKCSALKTLELNYCAQVTAAGFEAVSKGCPNLSELTLADIEVNMEDPRPILHTTEFSNLRKLSLDRCTSVFDHDIDNIATTSPLLADVRLYMCFNVSDVGVSSLSARCPMLKKLCVMWAQITSDSFAQLAKTSTQLTHLDINPVEQFDELDGVREAFTKLVHLRHLDVSNSSFLAEESVLRALVDSCPHLSELIARNCELCGDAMDILESADPPFQYVGEGTFER